MCAYTWGIPAVWLGPEVTPQDTGIAPRVPALAGFVGGASGYFVVAPRLFKSPPSQWLVFERGEVRIYEAGSGSEHVCANKKLVIESAPKAYGGVGLTTTCPAGSAEACLQISQTSQG